MVNFIWGARTGEQTFEWRGPRPLPLRTAPEWNSLGQGNHTAAAAAVLPVGLDLATHVVERLRPEPVDVAIDRGAGAADALVGLALSAVGVLPDVIRRRTVRRLTEVKGQVVDDVVRLRRRRCRHRRNEPIQTRLPRQQTGNRENTIHAHAFTGPVTLTFDLLGLKSRPRHGTCLTVIMRNEFGASLV